MLQGDFIMYIFIFSKPIWCHFPESYQITDYYREFWQALVLFLRATSQAGMLAWPFGDCRKGLWLSFLFPWLTPWYHTLEQNAWTFCFMIRICRFIGFDSKSCPATKNWPEQLFNHYFSFIFVYPIPEYVPPIHSVLQYTKDCNRITCWKCI